MAGLTGTITDVNVTLRGFQTRTQTWPEHTDVLLAAPNDANVILMADAGGDNNNSNGSLSDVDLTLDDEAAAQLPADTRLSTGTYRPVDDDVDRGGDTQPDTWLEPAPPLMDTTLLSTFDGLDPNGTWELRDRRPVARRERLHGRMVHRHHHHRHRSPAAECRGTRRLRRRRRQRQLGVPSLERRVVRPGPAHHPPRP